MSARARLLSAATAALLLTFVAASADAASVLALDVKAHLAEAHAVVEGVVGPSVQGVDADRGTPYTDTTIVVDRVLHGTAPDRVAVRQAKGTLGDRTMHIPGDGDLRPGERVVLFLVKGDGWWGLVALGQSVFEVAGSGPDARIAQQLGNLAMFTRDADGQVVPLDEPMRPPATLGALEAAIAAAKEDR